MAADGQIAAAEERLRRYEAGESASEIYGASSSGPSEDYEFLGLTWTREMPALRKLVESLKSRIADMEARQ